MLAGRSITMFFSGTVDSGATCTSDAVKEVSASGQNSSTYLLLSCLKPIR